MTNPLICEHGQLRRQCQHCDDAREILELRDENCQLRQILCNVLTACGNGSGAIPQASLEFFATVPDEVAAVVMKMGSEIDALRADAMRYQWLRGNCECMGWGSRSDAAIDAAMGAAMVRDGEDPALPDEDETCWECDQPFHLCECHVGADCGRWRNGHLSSSCSKAGSEECDFECPHRDSLYAHGAGVPVASKTSDGEPS